MEASNERDFTAVIVDDEMGSIETLRTMLDQYCPQVKVLQAFEYADEAIRQLPAIAPDLLFLDVEMPETDGFGLLDALKDQLQTKVVFTTAYPQYAVRAIEYAAMHYLVKPIEADKLIAAVDRYGEWHRTERDHETRWRVLLENRGKPPEEQSLVLEDFKFVPLRDRFTHRMCSLSTITVDEDNLFVPDREKVTAVRLDQIVRLLAVSGYTIIYCANGSQFIPARTLGLFEQLLTGDEMPFFRTHESHIINRKYIKSYTLKDPFEIEIEHAKDKIPLARRRKKPFKEWIRG
ncbi:MAG: LytR/AlgR family response regulator transcription factor [Saprospiraceae bacterium]